MESKDKQIELLEKKLTQLELQLRQLHQRVNFMERENNRRKGEVSQIANHINRK